MKRYISLLLAALMLFMCLLTTATGVNAAPKAEEKRAIAIVFDNSGSMYLSGRKEWCRATYAMEVFASMLNDGDILQIYPMYPIEVNGKEYTMEKPLQITDWEQAPSIEEIFTPFANQTPIESVDCAIAGLKSIKSTEKKYLILLTDGTEFDEGGIKMTREQTKKALGERINANAGKGMTVMYLGIGSAVTPPDAAPSDNFVLKLAPKSEQVLSTLTDMCNLIFGRDTVPKHRINNSSLDLDISMKKTIVFVQGDNISDLKLSGGSVGKLVRSQKVKFSTKGAGGFQNVVDETLQGMMVTYENCGAGEYTIDYTGTATSLEVYYEPDADLDFVFTDSNGNNVDPNALYEGEYKVSFGMKDAKTGKLIASDLLGEPHYQGSYFINGEEFTITHEGFSGETPIDLKMGDSFDARLTVTYLSGYTITKDSTDFGWPKGGIKVAARPAGELRLEITGGQSLYSLQDLKEGAPYIAKVYYQDKLLTGKELESVELKWQPETSNAEIKKKLADDHYELTLHYKNLDAPQDTVCGECTVTITALYSAQGSSEAQAQAALTYNIEDDFSPIQLDLRVPQTYIVIKDLDKSEAITVGLKLNGAMLTAEEFEAVELKVDCGGIEHTVTPNPEDSSYTIKFAKTNGIKEGKYKVSVTAYYTDHIDRTTKIDDSVTITLSTIPLWLKWLIAILILLLLAILIWIILHIKVLPKRAKTSRRLSSMYFDGDDVTSNANFSAEIKKSGAKTYAQYAGRKFGLSMDVVPGKESYLYKPHKRRSAEVKVLSLRKFGPAKINEALIGSTKYEFDEETGKLVPVIPNQKPYLLTNGMMIKYSGTIQDSGIDKDFEVMSKLNFNKK